MKIVLVVITSILILVIVAWFAIAFWYIDEQVKRIYKKWGGYPPWTH